MSGRYDEERTMVQVSWPNPASPKLPGFRVDVPQDWTATETPGALLVFTGPEVDGFRPNVVVSGDRVPETVGVGEIADGVLAEHGEDLQPGDAQDRPASADGLPIAVRRGSVTADGREVAQLVVATEAADRSPAGLRSVFVLTGTFLAERLHDDEPVIKDLIGTFALADG